MNICTSVTIVSLIYSFTGIGQCYDTGLLRLANDRNLPSNSAYMRKLNDLSQLREKKATGSMYQSLMARHFRRKVAFEKSRQNFSFDSGETNNPPLTTENNRQPSQYRSRSARPIQIPFAVQADSTVQEDFFNPPIRSQDKWTLVSPRSDTVRVLFGNPLDLLNFRKKSSLSPKILSPSLISLSNRGSVGGRRDLTNPSLLSPVFLSLNNRTDALLSLPELLKDQPDLYPVAKELINLLVSDLKKLRPSGRSLSPSGGRDRLTWIRFKREKLTRDYARSLKEFHDNVWLVNATLRNEWRRWYKENRQLNDQQLDSLMTFRSSKSFDDELDADENNCDPDHPNCPVIMKPFINDTERASNPLVLNPVIESPWILSPYMFGPFILSPVVLSPAVLSPNIFTPAILSPFLLAPFILSPLAFNPIILSPYVLNPLILSPGIFNPFVLSPLVLSPCIVSPNAFSPFILSPGVLTPQILCPSLFTEIVDEIDISPCHLCDKVLSPEFPVLSGGDAGVTG